MAPTRSPTTRTARQGVASISQAIRPSPATQPPQSFPSNNVILRRPCRRRIEDDIEDHQQQIQLLPLQDDDIPLEQYDIEDAILNPPNPSYKSCNASMPAAQPFIKIIDMNAKKTIASYTSSLRQVHAWIKAADMPQHLKDGLDVMSEYTIEVCIQWIEGVSNNVDITKN